MKAFGSKGLVGALGIVMILVACGGGGGNGDAPPVVEPPVPPPPAAPAAPSIMVQPQDVAAAVGGSVPFTVVAAGTALLAYQWQQDGRIISGANGATLAFAPVTAADFGTQVRVLVRNSVGTVASSAALLNPAARPGRLELWAGALGGPGLSDGTASTARLRNFASLTADGAGNVYGLDHNAGGEGLVRKLAPDGSVSTLYRAEGIVSVAASQSGELFLADAKACVIRRIETSGWVSAVAGVEGNCRQDFTPPDGKRFSSLISMVALDPKGQLYVLDWNMVSRASSEGNLVPMADPRSGLQPAYDSPPWPVAGMAADVQGNVYVSTYGLIRKITPDGKVQDLAGSQWQSGWLPGIGDQAGLNSPQSLALDRDGNIVFVAFGSCRIGRVSPAGLVTEVSWPNVGCPLMTPTGSDHHFADRLGGLTVNASGQVVVSYARSLLFDIHADGSMANLAGAVATTGTANGLGTAARFVYPTAITADSAGNVYVADSGNCTIRRITPLRLVDTYAGTVGECSPRDGSAQDAHIDDVQALLPGRNGTLWFLGGNALRQIAADGTVRTVRTDGLYVGSRIATDQNGELVLAGGMVTRLGNDGGPVELLVGSAGTVVDPVTGAFLKPRFAQSNVDALSIAFDRSGNLFLASSDQTITRYGASGVVTKLAGLAGHAGIVDGPSGTGLLDLLPAGSNTMVTDSAGNLYVLNRSSSVRMITPDGTISTIAGVPGRAQVVTGSLPGGLNEPRGMAIHEDASAVRLFVSDIAESAVVSIVLPKQ